MDQQVDLSPYDQNFTTKERVAPPSLVTQLTTYQDYFIHANTEMFQVRYSYLLQPYAIGPVNVRNTLNPKKKWPTSLCHLPWGLVHRFSYF